MSVDSITDELTRSILEEVERDLEGVRQDLERQLVDAAPTASGALRQSIHVDQWSLTGTTFETTAHADAEYAGWVDEGTGVYAGRGRIYPTSAKALVFEWHGTTVAFASVAGQPGQHFFQEPMERFVDLALERFGR